MIQQAVATTNHAMWPRWWRRIIIAISMLILCSCRSLPRTDSSQPVPTAVGTDHNVAAVSYEQPVYEGGERLLPGNSLPPSAWTGARQPMNQQWAPPGIQRPWPTDEYICDGGDQGVTARVNRDWTVHGLQMEDTVAHFDTIDGRTVIEPSNKVCIYAPRFGSVRRVAGVSGYRGKKSLVRYDVPTRVVTDQETLAANTTLQQVQTERSVNAKQARAQQRNNPGLQIAGDFGLIEANNGTKLSVNQRVLQDGVYKQAEEPQLAMRTESAAAWTIDRGVQIILDGTSAEVTVGDAKVQATYGTDRDSKPRLRIIKTASAATAQPGETIDFTLRFDNIGNESIGNVTIIDNLTTRLEYVPDSQTSSRESQFLTQTNDGDSLVLRWEIIDPVPAGESGVIHFKCRVR